MNAVKSSRLKIIAFLFALLCTPAIGQVANNNIADRIELKINELAHSNTNHASVEWNCIDKALTRKCLVYHNDQWFYFTPPDSGTYYINISSQRCKKTLGIQIIVIEGNPCETKSYVIKRCIEKIHQENVFIELTKLKANTQYLVNVDGFLNDFCEFEISFSDKPEGFPESLVSQHVLELKTETKDKLVTLTWRAGLNWIDSVKQFEIYRLKDGELKSVKINQQVVQRNSLGLFDEYYAYTDTLHQDGEYVYTILAEGESAHDRRLLDQIKIKHVFIQKYFAQLPLNFKKPGLLEIEVINAERKTTVKTLSFDYQGPTTLSVDLSFQVKYSGKRFWIRAKQLESKQTEVFAFEAMADGTMQLIGQ